MRFNIGDIVYVDRELERGFARGRVVGIRASQLSTEEPHYDVEFGSSSGKYAQLLASEVLLSSAEAMAAADKAVPPEAEEPQPKFSIGDEVYIDGRDGVYYGKVVAVYADSMEEHPYDRHFYDIEYIKHPKGLARDVRIPGSWLVSEEAATAIRLMDSM